MDTIKQAIRGVRWIQRIAHYGAGALLMALLFLTVANILRRNLFDTPITGTVEVTPLLLVVAVYLGFGYVELHGGHISVDLIYSRLGRGAQAASRTLSRVIVLVIIGLLIWQLWEYAGTQQDAGTVTPSLEWPIHVFVRLVAFGAVLFWLAALAEIVAELIGMDDADQLDDVDGVDGVDAGDVSAEGEAGL